MVNMWGWRDVPKRCVPVRMFWDPMTLKLIVPGDIIALQWNIPLILHYTLRLGWCKMAGMYQCRDIVFLGQFIWGTKGSQKTPTGTHRFGTSRHHTVQILGSGQVWPRRSNCLWLPYISGRSVQIMANNTFQFFFNRALKLGRWHGPWPWHGLIQSPNTKIGPWKRLIQ